MKQLLSFVAGLIVPQFFFVVFGCLLLFSTFTLSAQTLTERENIIALYFYSVLAGIILICFIARSQSRFKRKYTALGLTLSTITAIVFLIKIGILYFNQLNYYEPFNKTKWMTSEPKPFHMAKTLAKKGLLIGFKRKDVISKLGYDEETAGVDREVLIYHTEMYWNFCVDIKDSIVVSAYLIDPGID